jgi:hypothetical protein
MNQLASRVTPVLTLALSLGAAACAEPAPDPDDRDQTVELAGYQLVVATATTTPRDAQVQVACPKGTVILGGGFATLDDTGAYLEGTATAMVPSFDGRTWLVNGRNLAGVGSWQLRARAVCAAAPKGYQVLTGITSVDSVPTKQLALACPAGQVATGAGFATVDSTGVWVAGEATYFSPSWDGHAWLMNAQPFRIAQPWALRGWLVCVADGAVAGYQVHTTESALVAGADEQVIGACPGQAMIGAGWGVLDDTYAILTGRATAHEVDYRGRSWLTNAQNHSSFAPRWRLQQRALCAN